MILISITIRIPDFSGFGNCFSQVNGFGVITSYSIHYTKLYDILLAVILILSGRVYIRHFTKPLEQLSRDLRAFENNVFDISLTPPPTDRMTEEISDLYRDVELALEKIQDQVYKDYVKQMSLQRNNFV